jgi:chromosome segregation ATPase
MNDDGTVTLGDGTPVTMVFMPQSDYDTQMAQLTVAKEKVTKELSSLKGNIKTKDNEISELNNKLKEKETELSAKISSIVDLGKNISEKETVIAQKEELLQAKETEIAELLPYKEEVNKINAEKEALEIAEKKEAFKNEYLSTKLISDKDLEIAEVKEAIETMDDSKMKIFIAQKVIDNAKSGKPQAEIEVSEVKESKAEINLNATNDVEITADTFKGWFKNKR